MVINSRFKPFSYEEMLRPLAAYTDEYNAQEAAYGELADKAAQWERLKNSEMDQDTYQQYRNYANTLQQAADSLAKEGLKPGGRKAVQDARRKYTEEIFPIEQAYQKRAELSKMQKEMIARDPTLLIERGADQIALRELIANPELSPATYSGAYLEKSASQAASALAKEIRDNPRKWQPILGGQYYETRSRYGYTAKEISDALMGRGPEELMQVVQQVAQPIMGWNNAEAKGQALNYIARGMWNAIGDEKYQNLQNQDYLDPLARARLRKLGEQPTGNQSARPPILSGALRENDVVGGDKGVINYMSRGELPEEIAKAQDNISLYEEQMRQLKEKNPGLEEYIRYANSVGAGSSMSQFLGYAGVGAASLQNTSKSGAPKRAEGYGKYRELENKLRKAQETISDWENSQSRVHSELAREYSSLSNDPEEAAVYGALIEGAYSAYAEPFVPVNLDNGVRQNILSAKGPENFVEVTPNGKEKKVGSKEYEEIIKSGRLGLSGQGNTVTVGNRVFKIKDAGYEYNAVGETAKKASNFLKSWKQTPFKEPSNLTRRDFTPISDNLYGANIRVNGEPTKAIYMDTPQGLQPLKLVPVSQISRGIDAEGELLQWIVSENIIPVTEQWDNAPTASSTSKNMANVGYIGPAIYDDYYGF